MTIAVVQPSAGNSACVIFGGYVNSSTVKSCTLNHGTTGIEDVLSNGGNRYDNIAFNNVGQALFVLEAQAPTPVLQNCQFSAPGNQQRGYHATSLICATFSGGELGSNILPRAEVLFDFVKDLESMRPSLVETDLTKHKFSIAARQAPDRPEHLTDTATTGN